MAMKAKKRSEDYMPDGYGGDLVPFLSALSSLICKENLLLAKTTLF